MGTVKRLTNTLRVAEWKKFVNLCHRVSKDAAIYID